MKLTYIYSRLRTSEYHPPSPKAILDILVFEGKNKCNLLLQTTTTKPMSDAFQLTEKWIPNMKK